MRVALLLACLLVLVAVCVARKRSETPRKTGARQRNGRTGIQGNLNPENARNKENARTLDYKCDYRSDEHCLRCAKPAFAGEGVSADYIRDGIDDCTDKSDETPRTCNIWIDNLNLCWGCRNSPGGEGVYYNTTCDKFRDCADGSDEDCSPMCDASSSSEECFFCYDSPNVAVHVDSVCDNVPHCPDDSDEYCFDSATREYKYCSGDCKFSVSFEVVCDGKNDSWNGEDEARCFTCRDQSGFMINLDYVRDGYADCADGSDEWSSEVQGLASTSCTSWGEWGQWSTCSNTCGPGSRRRTRSCNDANLSDEDLEACEQDACPSEEDGTCGLRGVTQSRIVGGESAQYGEYPWQAQLLFDNNFVCGGTLYEKRYIISAAHCFQGIKKDPQRWKVHLGKLETRASSGPDLHESTVKNILWNEDAEYNTNTLDNDIVVLVLDSPVPHIPTMAINSICMGIDSGMTLNAFSNCYISGYGRTSVDGDAAANLQAAKVPLIAQNTCNMYYGGSITTNMLCAGYPVEGGIDSCQGDSGGPLVCSAPDGTDRWYLVGVTSWGYGCAYVGYPGVYTDMSKFRHWVKNTVDNYERNSLGTN